jgi:hypothetical protein
MAVQKNFVIRNGLEVNNNLLVADSATDYVGIGTSSPKYTLEVIGGIGVTYANILGIATVGQEFNVGTGGTVITSLDSGLTGFGTATPAYIVDIRSPVSTGQTALYVQGDVRVTGDVYADDISLDQATFNNIEVSGVGTIRTASIDLGYVKTGIVTNLVTTGIASVNTGVLTSAYVTTGIVTTISGTTLNYTGIGTVANFNATNATVSGLTTTGSLAVATGFDVYATDSTFHGSVTIDGNLSIGGTSAILNAVQVRVEDKDIILGFTTAITPSDDTSNHGGVAIASTEGYPLVSLAVAGINTLPDTYKQVMWVKRNTMGAGTTDAFLFNYAVGVGSTQVPNGVRFAAGSIQFTENVINTTNLNVTGVSTIANASVDLGYVKTGIVTNLTTSGIASITTAVVDTGYINTGIITALSGSNLSYSGIVTTGSVAIGATTVISSGRELQNIASLDATTTATIEAAIANAPNTFTDLTVTGLSTFVGLATFNSGLQVVSGVTTLGITTATDLTLQNLNVSGVSTLGTVRISSGILTASSGIVTYYGDGSYLTGNARNLTATIGVGTTGGVAGYGVSFIQFSGPGVSTVYYDGNSGIATVTISGGGSGSASIGIGTTPGEAFVGVVTAGNLWYNSSLGRMFIYYQDQDSAQWVDASPSNVGIITSLINVSFAPGSSTSPSMYFVGDQQTGFFSSGTGQFTVVSSGSSILNVNQSGIRITGVATAQDFDALSDIRYKENINTVNSALLKVDQLRGVKFNWKESGQPSYGVIAQELEEVLPELVHGDDPKTVNYNGIIGVLIEAIKELKAEIEELKK